MPFPLSYTPLLVLTLLPPIKKIHSKQTKHYLHVHRKQEIVSSLHLTLLILHLGAKYGTVSQCNIVLDVTAAPSWAPIACIVGVNREGVGRQKTWRRRSPLPSIRALPPSLTPAMQGTCVYYAPFESCFKLTFVVSPPDLSWIFVPGLQETSGLWSRRKET